MTYVLGTHSEELERLGRQHQIWQAEAWLLGIKLVLKAVITFWILVAAQALPALI